MSHAPCLTEIPDLGDIGVFATDACYDREFWDRVAEAIRKEAREYAALRARLAPTQADRNKQFNC